MPAKLASISALLAFALCLVVGGLVADNAFSTAVLRALSAMGGTFVIGLVVGSMAQKMMLDKPVPADQRPADDQPVEQQK